MTTSASRPPRTGCFFSLVAFEATVQSDPEILGLLYSGSLGSGKTDLYSDLDMDVWISAGAYAQLDSKLEDVLTSLGSIQFVYSRGPAFVTAFVGPDWQRVDLHLHGPADTKAFADYAHGRVVKDTDGKLARMVKRAPVEDITPSSESARAEIEEAIDSMVYVALHNARGEHWSAASEITGRISSLYTLLAGFRGRASHGLRYVAQTLTQEELELLTQAWPTCIERDEVRRAAAALWNWTRHVWREVERCLGQPLEIDLHEDEMLHAIDRFYPASSVV